MPTQMHHWLKVSPVVSKIRWRKSREVISDDREQRERVAPQLHDAGEGVAVEDRVPLVAAQQRRDHVEHRQRGEQHRRGDDRAVLVVADLVGDQRSDRHHGALGAEPDPVVAGEDRRADRARRAGHQAAGGLVEAERDRERDVDDHVQPQDLQRVQRGAVGDADDPGADEDRDVGDQGRHLEAQVLQQVVVEGAAVGDGADDRGEVVVGQDHHRGLLGDLGAGDAHGHADVGGLQRRGVVDAVAGHRDHVALLLEQPDQADLVLGRHPRDHPDLVELAQELLVAHRGELGAGDRPALDAELAGDRGGRRGVVAGDHPDPDPGVVALGDGGPGLRARRVDDADHRQQRELLDLVDQVAARRGTARVEVALRDHHDPLAGVGDLVVGLEGEVPVVVGDRRPGCRRGSGSSWPAR